MLCELRIQNLILIESVDIQFNRGLNILSGETGAGKSAIMKALHLLSGDKADASIIRHGAEKAIVEGVFDISHLTELQDLLEKSNLDHDKANDLHIRREVTANGKSRCLINNQLTQLTLLRKIGALLLEMVGQHANQKLLALEQHRHLTDIYGGHLTQVADFTRSWTEEKRLAEHLKELIGNESKRLREIEVCHTELEEIAEARLKEGEEEELFMEYTRLLNADEIASKLQEITHTLNGEKISVLSLLKKHTQLLDQLTALDASFAECATAHKNALLELQEIAYTLSRQSQSDYSPERLHIINERLTLIDKLKKKYGQSVIDIQHYQKATAQKLHDLETMDTQIEEGKVQLEHLSQKNQTLAQNLTAIRQVAATKLAKQLTLELQSLNMPKVEFHIDLRPQARTTQGDDTVEFFLVPNVGEKRIPIKEHASGGELSRILLALQTLLAGDEAVATIVFDEIDANIGGATAVVIGQKLHTIGQRQQVLCITHFPQVAKQADYHIHIEKKEKDGRTISHITLLDSVGRTRELNRMAGIKG